MVATERAPWQNTRVVTTLLFIFLAGASAGALSMRLFHDKIHPGGKSRDQGRDALQLFKAELNLTSEQTDKIAIVLEDFRRYYGSLQDQLDDLRSTGKSRILQILNPEQRVKFEKRMTVLAPQLAPPPPPANSPK
jgi:Spy/CpxP family protein refolding chaperone